MVEFLKQSVERLEPPDCPHCHIEMKWYRSFRPMTADAPDVIVHYFQCPNCSRIGEVATKPGKFGGDNGPQKLSAPVEAGPAMGVIAYALRKMRAPRFFRSSRPPG